MVGNVKANNLLMELRRVLITDCGSTTTKALLFEKSANGWSTIARGEAPTTVENPVADVTVGVKNAIREIEEILGKKLFEDSEIPKRLSFSVNSGLDAYYSTSSAGGGLQLVVTGLVGNMSTESATRAAMGAGAIVLDSISADDGRDEHEKVRKLRNIKPDIVLMTGGFDGGDVAHVIEVAELFLAANPRPRFGDTLALPIVYAGNKDAAVEVKNILGAKADVTVVPNVRPSFGEESLAGARDAIHELFLSHVMSHAPGYSKLLKATDADVLPTPTAVGEMIQQYHKTSGKEVLCVDIGGATTDVFSVFKHPDTREGIFNRTVSANLGMSYSIGNVLLEAGVDRIKRWLPFTISDSALKNRIKNKMVRPTSIPDSIEELYIEQAVCREALRLSLRHHASLATGAEASKSKQGIAGIFGQKSGRVELVSMKALNVAIGSGGVLSHAPSRLHAALMMIDGFSLEGITELYVDSVFMLPHLGALSQKDPAAAYEILDKECLVKIAHSIIPTTTSVMGAKKGVLVKLNSSHTFALSPGEVKKFSRDQLGESVSLELQPQSSTVDVGAGNGKTLIMTLELHQEGLIFDGRKLLRGNYLESNPENTKKIFKELGFDIC
jgi:uncharacterized protein (TIGR01319 family)